MYSCHSSKTNFLHFYISHYFIFVPSVIPFKVATWILKLPADSESHISVGITQTYCHWHRDYQTSLLRLSLTQWHSVSKVETWGSDVQIEKTKLECSDMLRQGSSILFLDIILLKFGSNTPAYNYQVNPKQLKIKWVYCNALWDIRNRIVNPCL